MCVLMPARRPCSGGRRATIRVGCPWPIASHLVGLPHLDLAANAHDRAGERRVDADWLDERWADRETRVLVVAGTRIRRVDGAIAWVPPAEASYDGRRVLLGERDGRAWFALIVDPDDAPGDGGEWVGLRAVLPQLAGTPGGDRSEAPLVLHAI